MLGAPFSGSAPGGHVGKLYDYANQIQTHIEHNDLDVFKARGEIAMRCGFLISLIKPDDPDDPAKMDSLRQAAKDAFGLELY
jgi:hypothetical protein